MAKRTAEMPGAVCSSASREPTRLDKNRGILFADGRLALAVALAGLAVFAAAIMLLATRKGVGLTSDSLIYINASDNLLEGRGLSRLSGIDEAKPITHYPPLFPLLLAGLQLLGLGPLGAARILVVLSFAGNTALVGLALRRMTGRMAPALAGSFLLLASPIMIELHSWAMSEPLFLFWSLLAIILLDAYRASSRTPTLLVLAAAAGAAYLTRYVGLSLVIAVGLLLALRQGQSRRRRVVDVIIFLAISLAPSGIWMARNYRLTGSVSNYRWIWHPPDLVTLKRPFAVLWEWLSPLVFNYLALLAVVALVLAGTVLCVFAAVRGRGYSPRVWLGILRTPDEPTGLALYALLYAASLGLSILFLGATIPLDQRLSSPLYVSAIVLAIGALAAWWWHDRRRLARLAVVLVAAWFAFSYPLRSVGLVRRLADEPQGYAGSALGQAGDVAAVRRIPADVMIYTNSFAPLEFFYGRGSRAIPLPADPVTGQAVTGYVEALQSMRERIVGGEAVMVLFFATTGDGRIPSELGQGLTLLCGEKGVMLYVGDGYRGPRDCGP